MKLRAPSRTVGVVSVGVVFLVATTLFAQQFAGAQSPELTTVKLVAEMITKYHISQKPIDDRVSAMLLTKFIKDLDPQKLYFLKSDIDSFSRYRDQLDDLLKVGQANFAHEAFSLYLRRLDERVAMAHSLIDAPHDFTLDESMTIDPDQVSWSADPKEINERWRKRIKFDLLNLQLDKSSLEETKKRALKKNDGSEPAPVVSATIEDPRKRLHKRYDILKKYAHDTDEGEVLAMYLSSLAHCYDPHSSYMSPEENEDFQIQMRLSLQGIGAALRSEEGVTTVASIVEGGAAAKDSRLVKGDKIIGVAQDDGDFQDVVAMKLNRVVRLIRGKMGTKVRLKVLRDVGDVTQTLIIDLVRQTIELHNSEVKGEIIQTTDFGIAAVPGSKGRIGVISVPSFYRDFSGAQQGRDDFRSAARDVSNVLRQFRNDGGVDAVIVDLRMNGGGALSEAIEMTGLFIDKGPVVQVKELNGRIKSHDDEDDGVEYAGPLMVVCNRLSASASEIFAAAIKDYGRGIVVGDTTTHGKGTVQNVMPVSSNLFKVFPGAKDRGVLKLTINQFYRVNGDSTQNRGVESDVVLPSFIDHMDLGESFLDNALAFDHIPAAPHARLTYVNPQIVNTLSDNSHRRVAVDPKFQQTQKDVDRYLARKNRKSVSLNEETLRHERDEDKAAKDVEKEEEEHENKSDKAPVFAKSEYNTELLAVSVDYVTLLKAQKTAATR